MKALWQLVDIASRILQAESAMHMRAKPSKEPQLAHINLTMAVCGSSPKEEMKCLAGCRW